MNIGDAAKALGITRRAIKLYEEQGLLSPVARRDNGYRDYTQDDLDILRRIQLYRKLGVGLSDIRRILSGEGDGILEDVLARKRAELAAGQQELAALEAFIRTGKGDIVLLDEAVDFPTILEAIRAQLPGFWGGYIAAHFAPYLQTRITTPDQREAYHTILTFWDEPKRWPLSLYVTAALSRLIPRGNPQSAAEAMDARMQAMLNPTPEQYDVMLRQVRSAVRMRKNPLVRYSPGEVIKRRSMRAMQACGYNDVFIPAMKRLSPAYAAYHDALDTLNERMRRDIGLHYDDKFNLVTHEQK